MLNDCVPVVCAQCVCVLNVCECVLSCPNHPYPSTVVIGLGWKQYFSRVWNVFDFAVVLLFSAVEIASVLEGV